jgi:hypothetical protein
MWYTVFLLLYWITALVGWGAILYDLFGYAERVGTKTPPPSGIKPRESPTGKVENRPT